MLPRNPQAFTRHRAALRRDLRRAETQPQSNQLRNLLSPKTYNLEL